MAGIVRGPEKNFWQGKNVLITGHTGFTGSWFSLYLNYLGANVSGLSLPPETSPNLFSSANVANYISSHYCDLRDEESVDRSLKELKPDIIFHLAAKSLVQESYADPVSTYYTNIMGTVNLLNSARKLDTLKSIVIITTDKVYKPRLTKIPYIEEDELGGMDPYSASKSAVELVVDSFKKSYYQQNCVAISTARAGNIIGGGDWSKNRLVPDAVIAWENNKTLKIRNPKAIRPWQFVLDPLNGYLSIGSSTFIEPRLAGAFNLAPSDDLNLSVEQFISISREVYEKSRVKFEFTDEFKYESEWLALDPSKAKKDLGITTRVSQIEAIKKTFYWYKNFYSGVSAYELCTQEISEYEQT
jgi:CDP-glucose 4,6-dehydratase